MPCATHTDTDTLYNVDVTYHQNNFFVGYIKEYTMARKTLKVKIMMSSVLAVIKNELYNGPFMRVEQKFSPPSRLLWHNNYQ